MSNWLYANVVPTYKWRNAMTIPRELKIKHAGNDILVASVPVKELIIMEEQPIVVKNNTVIDSFDIGQKTKGVKFPCRLNLDMDSIKDFLIVLSNDMGEQLLIGFDKSNNQFYIDRTKSGKTDFQKDFAVKDTAQRFIKSQKMDVSLIIDVSSVELFADKGLTVMTALFFPRTSYDRMHLYSGGELIIKELDFIKLKSIWK